MQSAPATTGDAPQFYIIPVAESRVAAAMTLAESLRDRHLRVECHFGGGSLKSQLKRADKSAARYAVLLEADGQVFLKDLRGSEGQRALAMAELDSQLVTLLADRAGS